MAAEPVSILRLRENASAIQCKRYSVHSCSTHYHRFYEIELTVAGSGTHLLNGIPHPICRGEMHLLRPTDFHELIIDGEAVVHLIQIPVSCLSDQIIHSLHLNRGNLIACLSEQDFLSMDSLCALIERLSGQPDSAALTESLLTAIILYFLRHVNPVSPPQNQRVRDVMAYMQAHFSEDIDLARIAAQFYLHKNYLCSLFREGTGMTVVGYLRELRLEYAARLALTTELPSIEICAQCGYRSVSNFLRDFKQKYHISPLQLRNRSRS